MFDRLGVLDQQIGIEFTQRAPHGLGERLRIARRSHHQIDPERGPLRDWQKDVGGAARPEVHVGDDPDDRPVVRRITIIAGRNRELTADGLAIRPHRAHERLVDDGHARR